MKKIIYLLTSALLLSLSSCKKVTNDPPEGSPAPEFWITFILVDSAGNNLLPYPLPPNPVFDPDDFWAYSDRGNDLMNTTNVNSYYYPSINGGYAFLMVEGFYEIRNDPDFQQDSIFTWYACFGEVCDTVVIHKNHFRLDMEPTAECSAQKIIWGQDTIRDYHCTAIPIYKNF